jgi:hypothetical protein
MRKSSRAPGAHEEEPAAEHQLSDAVRRKVIEVADLLRHELPDEPVPQRALKWLIALQTQGANADFYRQVLAAFPDVEPGETGGAYGDRVLAGVRR